MDKNRHIKKETILSALESSLGVVTTACKKTGIPRSTFYKWLKEDEIFAKKVKDIENVSLDFAESKLFEQMADNNTSATIFYLKTKGRKRGYWEKQQHDITTDDEPIQINIKLTDED
jgi:predicted DNA-binding transcriptional regulator AlpA|tara:strand:- start:163 stop:513 length:351 start_codon:yes stop_codon:yes gene_type:complete